MKQRKMSQKLKNRIWNGSMIAALLTASAVFVFMLQTEKKELSEYEKTQVCVAATEIPRGEKITSENVNQYITIAEIDKKIVPQSALQGLEDALERVTVYGVEKGTALTTGMLQEEIKITGQMEDPVIAGFRAEDLYQVAGGVLRAGDKIHIYCVDSNEETGDGQILWENVHIQQVFDQSGTAILGNDTVTPAQRINVFLDKKDIAGFYTALAQGSLRAVKVCDY